MTETAEVVIIGGGVVGASVAYHLTEAGCRDVLIVERGAHQGTGSTGRATGGVRAQFGTEINIRMSLYSIEFFARFAEATGHDCGYEPNGYLFFATSEAQFSLLKANRERQLAAGLKDVEVVGVEVIAEMSPGLRVDDMTGGVFCQTDGLIDPLAVMRGFTGRARERGARLWIETGVGAIEVKGGQVVAVQTTRGRIETRAVVNAAGAWAAEVARMAGVELPVTPLRRQLVATKPVGGIPDRLPMVIDASDGFHFRRLGRAGAGGDRGLLLSWPDPEARPGFKDDFDSSFIPKVLARAAGRVPSLAGVEVDLTQSRAGLYEMTPDHHAIIGAAPGVRGFYLANGFSGHGVMHSPATGRMVAELIVEGRVKSFDAAQLGLDRFAAGRLIEETALI